MFSELTIYTTSADLTTLSAVLNGVAMICKQTAWIWGFAVLVSTIMIMRSVTAAAIQSGAGKGGAALVNGSLNIFMPMIFAVILTGAGMKTTVQLQSTSNSKVSAVDNVPIAIAIIPATASLMSQELGALVETAFQSVGTEYSSISARGQGFINPLKVLLTSRTAIMRLGSVDSQIRSVVGACINSDSGVDYSDIIEKVKGAGNKSMTSTINIKGVTNTAIAQLLYQASLNQTSFVPDLNLAANDILTCPEAAQLVANNISSALDTIEFKRVVQGAVNGMDQPITNADFSFDRIVEQYSAIRTSTSVSGTLAGGSQQANTEVLNLLFDEIVSSNLNCLRADGPNKTACQAASMQALEIERTNIQRAASEVQMLKYAGSFANHMMALIIGLGPVIILFMMFSGINSGKSIYMAIHVTVWPLLVLNVGAELINGMVYVHVANFLATVTQGGYLSQSGAIEAYKEFSLQVGTASHIMASLPVLMSMIFALGASSASVSVASKMTPNDSQSASATTPHAMDAAPILKNSPMAAVTQGDGWHSIKQSGATDFVNQRAELGELANTVTRGRSEELAKTKTISAGQSQTSQILSKAGWTDSSSYGVDKTTLDRISTNARSTLSNSDSERSGRHVSATKLNGNNTTLGAGAALTGNLGLGSAGGRGFGLGGSIRGDTAAQSSDSLSSTTDAQKSEEVNRSKAVESAIGKELSTARKEGKSHSDVKALEKMLSTQQQYTKSLTETESERATSSSTDSAANKLVGYSQNINGENLAQHAVASQAFRSFQMREGREFENNPAVKAKILQGQELQKTGATDQLHSQSPLAQAALVRTQAAVAIYSDKSQSSETRRQALDYLTGQAFAINGTSAPKFGSTEALGVTVGNPTDQTGTRVAGLENAAARLHPVGESNPKATPAAKGTKTKARQSTANIRPSEVPIQPPQVQEGSGLKTELANQKALFNRADEADLNQESTKGTTRRAFATVGENIKSTLPGTVNKKTSAGQLETPNDATKK
jgi:conjugal transfer mating pair stabilization protein TraG